MTIVWASCHAACFKRPILSLCPWQPHTKSTATTEPKNDCVRAAVAQTASLLTFNPAATERERRWGSIFCCWFNQTLAGWRSLCGVMEAERWWLQTAACHLSTLVSPVHLWNKLVLSSERKKLRFVDLCLLISALHLQKGALKYEEQYNMLKLHFPEVKESLWKVKIGASLSPLFQENGRGPPSWNSRTGKHYCTKAVQDGTLEREPTKMECEYFHSSNGNVILKECFQLCQGDWIPRYLLKFILGGFPLVPKPLMRGNKTTGER